MNKYLLTFLLISSIFSNYVDSIIITGNNNTKEYIIKREIYQTQKSLLDSINLIEDKNRLYNLGIFSTVDVEYKNRNYYVNLVESFSILPDLIIDYSELKKKWSYGLALAHINFLGMNQKLYIGGAFIGEKWFVAAIENPWVVGDHVSFGLVVFNRFSDNPFYDFTYNENFLSISSGFYKDFENKYSYDISYYKNEKDLIENLGIIPENERDTYKYINFGFNFIKDTRDIYRDPLKGYTLDISLDYSLSLLENNLDVFKFDFSFEKYTLLKSNLFHEPVISYKFRSLLKYPKFKALPIHEYEYIGGEDYVRGYSAYQNENPPNFDKIIEVSNILYGHLEFQSTLLEKKDYGKMEFGIDGLLFMNTGVGSKLFDNFSSSNILFGYGFGFKFFITGPPPISVMFGFNPYGQNFTHFQD